LAVSLLAGRVVVKSVAVLPVPNKAKPNGRFIKYFENKMKDTITSIGLPVAYSAMYWEERLIW
jgi:hypothetical protein